MTFKMIEPETVGDAALASSTVPETDAPEWDALTDYAVGAEVMVIDGYHAIFRAAAASGPSHGGAVDPTADDDNSHWVNIRSTNRWRAFDRYIGDPTVQADSAEWEIHAVGMVDSVALFGLAAATVTVHVEDSLGNVVYDQSHSLQDETSVVDAYSYCFTPIIRLNYLLVTDIPPYLAPTVTVTVNAAGEDVEVGQVVIGRQEAIGEAIDQVPLGIEDFSRKERDAEFGRFTVQERDFADLMTVPFAFPTIRATYLRSRLASRRAKLTVFAADSRFRENDYAVFGFFTNFQAIARIADVSEGTIELESIT